MSPFSDTQKTASRVWSAVHAYTQSLSLDLSKTSGVEMGEENAPAD